MASEILKVGTKVTVKTREGNNEKGSVITYVKSPSGKATLYHVKLDKGNAVVVWPEQVTALAGK